MCEIIAHFTKYNAFYILYVVIHCFACDKFWCKLSYSTYYLNYKLCLNIYGI